MNTITPYGCSQVELGNGSNRIIEVTCEFGYIIVDLCTSEMLLNAETSRYDIEERTGHWTATIIWAEANAPQHLAIVFQHETVGVFQKVCHLLGRAVQHRKMIEDFNQILGNA